jgi:ubiquinone/menaquinone biosynthesis C-methylase UbiE
MRPDVICYAEELPFADSGFDLAVTRVAAHHFADVAASTRELGRVAGTRVVVVDNLFMDDAAARADKLRYP